MGQRAGRTGMCLEVELAGLGSRKGLLHPSQPFLSQDADPPPPLLPLPAPTSATAIRFSTVAPDLFLGFPLAFPVICMPHPPLELGQ